MAQYIAEIGKDKYLIDIVDNHHILMNGEEYKVDFQQVGNQPIYSLIINGKSYEASVCLSEETWDVLLLGQLYRVRVVDEHDRLLRESVGKLVASHTEYLLKSPMPGLIISIPVREGQRVNRGDVLVILESMKMQNELKSPRQGKIDRICVKIGENVDQNQLLLSVI